MRIVTKKEFVDFVLSQPDDREVNWDQYIAGPNKCGCPMLQYAREVLKDNELSASSDEWYGGPRSNDVAAFEKGFGFENFYVKDCVTYGPIKARLMASGSEP